MFEGVKDSIYETITSSTAHGIPNIIRSRRFFHKVMWTFCTAISTATCCWFIYTNILKYLDYSVITNIKTIYEQPTIFPTVSICSDNRTLFREYSLKSLIKKCVFNYDSSCKSNPDNYFEPFEETEYDLCYRFNSGKNMTGHTIPLLYSNIGGMDDSLLFEITTNKGLIIWVHNSSTPPKREFMNNHNGEIKFASYGSWSHLVVERIFDKKLGEPYNQCLNDVNEFKLNKTLINHIKSLNEVYEQVNCLELCFDLDYITNNSCNCSSMANNTISIGKVWEQCFRKINDRTIKSCTMNVKSNFYEQSLVDKCSNYCPLECDSYSYTVNTNSLYQSIENKVTIFVYYRTLKYTLITQQPEMVISDLVSNVGGIFGLFIGISFLSFIEIIEIITEVIFSIFSYDGQNKVKNFA